MIRIQKRSRTTGQRDCNGKRPRLYLTTLFSTLILAVVLSPALFTSSAAAGQEALQSTEGRQWLRVVFHQNADGISLERATAVPARKLCELDQHSAGNRRLRIVDQETGEVVVSRQLEAPSFLFADTVEAGKLTGGRDRSMDGWFTAVIPGPLTGELLEIVNGSGGLNPSERWDAGDLAIVTAGMNSLGDIPVFSTETVYETGDSANRLDLVILGDGYLVNELGLYDAHVEQLVSGLLAREPFTHFTEYLNIHKVNVISQESGTDQPDLKPPVFVDTALNSSFDYAGVDRLLYAQSSLVLEAADLVPEYDTILLIVNTSRYGGGAGSFCVFAGGSSSAQDLALHELGHSFGGLTDEYDQPYDTYTGGEPASANCTTRSWIEMTGQMHKWYRWLGLEGVGLYEGCEYYSHGKYRPAENCLMRSLGHDYCPVCREAMALSIFDHASPVDSTDPETGSLLVLQGEQTRTFTVNTVSTEVRISWFLDGKEVIGEHDDAMMLSAANLEDGNHVLEAEITVNDSWILADPDGRLTSTVGWDVRREQSPTFFELQLSHQDQVSAGETLTIDLVIGNTSDSAQGFNATLDLIRCDGERINGLRRGSGTLQAGAEKAVSIPLHIPGSLPPSMIDCPMTLELLVAGTSGVDSVSSVDGTFTVVTD